MVVSPRGEVLGELRPGQADLLRHTINLDEVAGWYLGQRRQDVLSLAYRGSDLSETDVARTALGRVETPAGREEADPLKEA
jgi:hypothetical protein